MGIVMYFDKFNRHKELMIFLVSFLGFLCSFGYFVYLVFVSDWDLSYESNVILLLLINFFFIGAVLSLLLRYQSYTQEKRALATKSSSLNNRVEELTKKLAESDSKNVIICSIIHNILHEGRNLIVNIYSEQARLYKKTYCLYNEKETTDKENDSKNYKLINGIMEKYMHYLLSNLKTLLDLTTSHYCRVCIKIIDPLGVTVASLKTLEKTYVTTYMRDHISYRQRATNDSLYSFPFQENTAFKRILDPNFPYCHYFLENDLLHNEEYESARSNFN